MTSKQKNKVGSKKVVLEEETEDEMAKKAMEEDDLDDEDKTEASKPAMNIESLIEQIEALKKSAADSLDREVRAQAELDNVRKRTARDIENAHRYALDKFINELLPVLDSMELGMNASAATMEISSLREGMDLTMKMFSSSLEKSGVRSVEPQKDDKFNPEQHEAVTMQEMEDIESGAVITTLQKGYELNGRLIRPAMVIVAK